MSIKQKIIGILLALIALLGGGNYVSNQLGSVESASGGYYATTTDSTWNTAASTAGGFKLLRNGPGILGSVIITNDTAGSYTLYDATTTRNGAVYGTTTVARIPASLAEGTYTFDTNLRFGLIAEFQSTNVATSTITWK